ncbi:FtsX-like permease family protein [Oceanispirochaeta sp.]|jgi:putative ABC transport system permease protein|uniref:ABC transporter permease n=1 Tax=Oceanispirochaeta sp. TaxID=2035350 RepID=UPI002621D80B|nr:FtsX-like permease family protein [Oceanispirochaeta sp.]MDA3958752.1 FtsX-like permease family protein [Oceanispirochaeta sp.]
MTFLPQMAVKNLFRYGRRTLITASAIAIGITAFILMDSVLKGIGQDSERNLIWYETGSAAFFHPEYWEDRSYMPLDRPVEQSGELVDALRSRHIEASPRIEFGGDLIIYKDPFPEDGNLQVRVTAIDVDHDSDVFKIKDNVARGRYLEAGEEGLLMGQWLARDMGADVGYEVTIVTRTIDGYYQTMDLTIVGILESENPIVNRYGMYVPLDTARYALDMDDRATGVYISLPRGEEETIALKKLAPLAAEKGLSLVDWRVMGADFVALAEAKKSGSSVVLYLVFLIAAVGISNTILMSIFERVRELGMMRALGMKDRSIRILFLMEAAGIGLMGSIGGVILGALANIPLVNKGIDYSELLEQGDMGYRISSIMYGTWDTATFMTAFFIGLFMAVLVAWLPTRRALKLGIPVCLRYN